MYQWKRAVPLLLAVILAGAGCSDQDPVSPASDTAVMTAEVDGRAWTANFQVQLAVADYYPAEGKLDVVGLERTEHGALRQISMEIDDYAGPGRYEVGGPDAPAWAYYVFTGDESRPDLQQTYFSDGAHTGTITIESFDEERAWVTGTFAFSAASAEGAEVEVTTGVFEGRYAEY